MANDPWAVKTVEPAEPPAANDPWAVKAVTPVRTAPAKVEKPGFLAQRWGDLSSGTVKAAKDLYASEKARYDRGPQMGPHENLAQMLLSPFTGAVDDFKRAGKIAAVPLAVVAAPTDLAIKPTARGLDRATGGRMKAEDTESTLNQALMLISPGKGKLPKLTAADLRPGRASKAPKPEFVGKPVEGAAVPAAATPPPAPAKGPGAAPGPARAMAAARGEPAPAPATAEAAPKPVKAGRKAAAASAPPPIVDALAPELMGAKPKTPVLNPDAPGPVLDMPPKAKLKTETTDQFGTRVDDALHRLTGNADADKLHFAQRLKELPKEITDPAIQARVYDDIERRMINPKAPITPGTEAAHAAMAELRAEEAQLFKNIKARGYSDMVSGPEVGDGYVHRVVKGKGSYMDAADAAVTGGRGADPVMPAGRSGGSTLSKDASSLRARKFLVLEHPDGTRSWVDNPAGMQVDQPFLGPNMQFLKPRYATTAEIEANTGVRYHKNALVNTVDNVVRLRAVERNIDLLEQLKTQMGDKGLIHYQQTPGLPPDHFVQLTMPQFKGAYADPKVAHVLNDFHGQLQRGGDFSQIVGKINRFLTGSIFITPIPHAWNVANHWATGRGWDWIKPIGMQSLMQDGTRAIKAVLTQNRDYQALLREGSGLVYGGIENQNFHKLLIDKLGGEILADKKAWAPIAKMFGYASPVKLVKAIYKQSSKILWAVNDMFMVQRQLELMRKGMPVRKAILEAEKDIPNYRLPSYVGPKGMGDSNRRALSEVMRNPNLMMFGRYRHGQFKAYAEMAKEMFRPGASKQERIDGAGKLFVMAALAMGAYPIMDSILRMATGNDHAEVHRGGGLTPAKAVVDVATGEKSWGAGMSSIYGTPPLMGIAADVTRNLDGIGRAIVEPASTATGKTVQAVEYAGSKISPIATALNVLRKGEEEGGVASALAPMAALKIPTDKQIAGKEKGKMYAKRRAAKREARSPLQRIVEELIE